MLDTATQNTKISMHADWQIAAYHKPGQYKMMAMARITIFIIKGLVPPGRKIFPSRSSTVFTVLGVLLQSVWVS
jgi:hypothetical protein